jgi:hypothetical protein
MGEEEIKIIKKEEHKKFEDYTFIDNNIELKKIGNENDRNPFSSYNDKKYKEYVSKLRNNPKNDMKTRDKSRLAGGHGTQSHSPVYE